ncbi:MAG: AraC family transcriptional regulator [Thermoanaerobaculia bacterium]
MAPIPPLETILFRSERLTIGRFHAAPDHPDFHDSGPIHNSVFVFPRTAVRIQHLGSEPFVADPNLVTYYNRGQEYRRTAVDSRGDHCEWFAVEPAALAAAVDRFERRRRPERPFAFREAPSDAKAYLLQRLVVRHLGEETAPDRLLVEESVERILERLMNVAYRRGSARDEPAARPARRHWVGEVSQAICERLDENLSLHDLARRCGVSAFYLCRAFRAETGDTIHRHRTRLRLRSALEWVTEDRGDLTDIALSFGFSSHSHFTDSFRREFGIPPSRLRREGAAALARRLRSQLEPSTLPG